MAYKITPAQNEKLKAALQQHNKAVKAALKDNPKLNTLGIRTKTLKEIKKDISSRSDLDRITRSLNAASRKNAFKLIVDKGGAKYTKWQEQELKKAVAQVNRKRAERRKLIPKNAHLRGMMTFIGSNFYKDKVINWGELSQQDFNAVYNLTLKQAQSSYEVGMDQLYKDNYHLALIDQLGDDAEILWKVIKSVPNLVFFLGATTDADLYLKEVYTIIQTQGKAAGLQLLGQKWIDYLIKTKQWETLNKTTQRSLQRIARNPNYFTLDDLEEEDI